MPDILSVGLQDILYRRKSELRKQISDKKAFSISGKNVYRKLQSGGVEQFHSEITQINVPLARLSACPDILCHGAVRFS